MARMRVLGPEGPDGREVHPGEEASNLGRYWADLHYYLDTGDDERLRRHEGETYGGAPAFLDTDAIDDMAYEGVIEIDGIYEPEDE